jgi:hypothetical protein
MVMAMVQCEPRRAGFGRANLRMLAADTLVIAHTCAAPTPIILAATPAACAGFLWTAQQGALGHQQDAHSTLKQTKKYEREELNKL